MSESHENQMSEARNRILESVDTLIADKSNHEARRDLNSALLILRNMKVGEIALRVVQTGKIEELEKVLFEET